MTSANQRGWGPGWPDCQQSKCVWVEAGGIRLLVRAEVAPIFKGFCDDLVSGGYPLGGVADDWGFACRAIRGTQTASNHSWGLAIDLNSTANPMGARLVTNFPAWAVNLGEQKYHLKWGGRYPTRPDAMHWEWLGTPQQARDLVAALAAGDDDMPLTDTDILKVAHAVSVAIQPQLDSLEADIKAKDVALRDSLAALQRTLHP